MIVDDDHRVEGMYPLDQQEEFFEDPNLEDGLFDDLGLVECSIELGERRD